MAKKLAKAQMGKIVGTVSKAMKAKVIPRGLPTTVGTLAGAGYVANEVYNKPKKKETKKPVKPYGSDTTAVKKKMGGNIKSKKK